MKKRILSMLMAICMALSVMPMGVFAIEDDTLAMMMMDLGIVDENGALIEDNTFTVEDGTKLSSLDALYEWLLTLDEEAWENTMVTVDATGMTTTAEYLGKALDIEYQINRLADTLNLLASGDTSGTGETSAAVTASTDVDVVDNPLPWDLNIHNMTLEIQYFIYNDHSNDDILYFTIGLVDIDDNTTVYGAPHDIQIEVGMFGDFLTDAADANIDYGGAMGEVPGANYFKYFTIPKGESGIAFEVNLSTIRDNYLQKYEKLLDGNVLLMFEARSAGYDMAPCSDAFAVKMAPQTTADAMVEGTKNGYEIGRWKSDDSIVIPYFSNAFDKNNTFSYGGKTYFSINMAKPAIVGATTSEEATRWESEMSKAIRLGIGNASPSMNIDNVSLVTKNGQSADAKRDWDFCFKFPVVDKISQFKVVNATNRSTTVSDDEKDAYYSALAYALRGYFTPENEFIYRMYKKQLEDGNTKYLRLKNFSYPLNMEGMYGSLFNPNTWGVGENWIEQSANKDIVPYSIVFSGKMKLEDDVAPTVESITTQAKTKSFYWSSSYNYSTFYPGEIVPITVTFSEPVYGDYELVYQIEGTGSDTLVATLGSRENIAYRTIDSSVVRDDENILSKTRTFYYEVGKTDGNLNILGVRPTGNNCTDISEENTFATDATGWMVDGKTKVYYQSFPVCSYEANGIIEAGKPHDTISRITARDNNTDPENPDLNHFTVEVELENDTKILNDWSDWHSKQESGGVTYGDSFNNLSVGLYVGNKLYKAKKVQSEDDVDPAEPCSVYLTNDGKLMFELYLDPVEKATKHHIALYLSTAHSGNDADGAYWGQDTPYVIQYPLVPANENAYTLSVVDDYWPSGKDYTMAAMDDESPTFTFTKGTQTDHTYKKDEMFFWKSSDEDILKLKPTTGTSDNLSILSATEVSAVLGSKTGEVQIMLMSTNNSTDPADYTVASKPITINVLGVDYPTLKIFKNANTFYARQKEDLVINFVANLSEYAPATNDAQDGKILVELYTGEAANGTPIWSEYIDRASTSVTLPGALLQTISKKDSINYVLKLSATAIGEGTDLSLTTYANVVVRSQPAVITFTGLSSPQFVSGKSIRIDWKVENYDLENNPEECKFEFDIQKDGVSLDDTVTDVGTKVGEQTYQGSFSFIPTEPDGLKEFYIVTAKAKNVADPTWSIASSTITIYKNGALDILVGGNKTDSVTLANQVSGGTSTAPVITTYGGETFTGLQNAAAIAQLRSSMSLMESISINYKDYDWGLVSDRIKWETTTLNNLNQTEGEELQDVITINYFKNNNYAPIDSYNYTAYIPQVIFLLSGIADGNGRVTATHNNLPELNATLDVRVERLWNKLYLFQFTPALATIVSYTDGKGEQHTVTSNADGSLALFEPNGIASDLWTSSNSGGVAYRGTINKNNLLSGEGNGVYGELYPLNTLELRQAAQAQVQLLKPDGTPLANTNVTLRGGVYRNMIAGEFRDDYYCENAKFAKNSTDTANLDGTVDQTFTTDANGVLTVYMDISQFTTKENPEPVGQYDSVQFIFEVRFPGDAYQPELIVVNGSLTQVDAIRSAQDILTLIPANGKKPFMARSTINYTAREISLREHTGVVGPSSEYSVADLTATMMLWGLDNVSLTDTGYHFDLRAQQNAASLPDQFVYNAENASYPFSSIPLLINNIALTSERLADYPAERRVSIEAALYDKDDKLVSTIALPYGLIDISKIGKVSESATLLETMSNLMLYGDVDGTNNKYGTDNDFVETVGPLVLKAMNKLDKLGNEMGLIKTILMPTEDPTCYEAYLWTGMDTTTMADLRYDAHGVYIEPTHIAQNLDTAWGVIGGRFRVSDFQAMADGTYLEKNPSAMQELLFGKDKIMQGWMTAELNYDFNDGKWDVIMTGGGFKYGTYTELPIKHNFKTPIPVTIKMVVGGGYVIDMQTAIRYAEQLGLEWSDEKAKAVNDYLTSLRINVYLEAYAGLGLGKSIMFTFGFFGKMELNNENRFLRRQYLKEESLRSWNGQFVQVDGELGIQVKAGIGPLNIEWTAISIKLGNQWRFENWNDIDTYWKKAGSGLTTEWLNPKTSYSSNGYRSLSMAGDTVLATTVPEITMQSRDYLTRGERGWYGGDGVSAVSLDAKNKLAALQTNAFPYSMPQIADDGSILVYLSDADSTSVEDVEVRYSLLTGDVFPEGVAIADPVGFAGYGDSTLDFDGDADHAGAIWLREAASTGIAAGTVVSESEQLMLLNGLEVVASIWDGDEWKTTRLTENGTQEANPMIAVNDNGQAIAVWRSVQTGESAFDLTMNRIYCKIYNGSAWSDAYTLYNGSTGEVNSIDVELLNNGNATVAFSLANTENDGSDIYYTLLDTNDVGTLEDNAKTIRATTSDATNTDPMLTTVWENTTEYFVLGWNSQRSDSSTESNDVGLSVFDNTGAPRTDFPDALSSLVSTASYDGQFTFVKGAETLENLSILWNDSRSGEGDVDVIRAIKFGYFGDEHGYGASAPIAVADMPSRTSLNYMDACLMNGDTVIHAVLQGTISSVVKDDLMSDDYDPTSFKTVECYYTMEGEDGTIEEYSSTANVPIETVHLYSATGIYEDAMAVTSVAVDYASLAKNSYVPVTFTVENQGMHVIDTVQISLGGAMPQTFTDLDILPGESKIFSVVTKTSDTIQNISYKIEATFDDAYDTTKNASGTVYLDYPDVGVSTLTLTKEQDGERTFLANVYNQSAATVQKSNRRVVLGVYADAACENPFDAKYFGGTAGESYILYLNDEQVKQLEEATYTHNFTFDIAPYIADAKNQANTLTEIPSGGVTVFVKAYVEQNVDGTWVTLPEADDANNQKYITFDSLLERADAPITMSIEMQNNASATSANVQIQNNSLQKSNSGYLVAALLNKNGALLETQKIGDIELDTEESVTQNVTFTQIGTRVVLRYGDTSDTPSSTTPKTDSITIDGVPLTFDEQKTATANNLAAGDYLLTIVPKDSEVTPTVTVNGAPATLENGMLNVKLTAGSTNTIVVTVGTDTYTITLTVEPDEIAIITIDDKPLVFDADGYVKLDNISSGKHEMTVKPSKPDADVTVKLNETPISKQNEKYMLPIETDSEGTITVDIWGAPYKIDYVTMPDTITIDGIDTLPFVNGQADVTDLNAGDYVLRVQSSEKGAAIVVKLDGTVIDETDGYTLSLKKDQTHTVEVTVGEEYNAHTYIVTVTTLPDQFQISDKDVFFDENNHATVEIEAGEYNLHIDPSFVNDPIQVIVDGRELKGKNGNFTIKIKSGEELDIVITVGEDTYSLYMKAALSPLHNFNLLGMFHTLTFDSNGGTPIREVRRKIGSTIDLSQYVPTRVGYIFTGWYADPALTEPVHEIQMKINITVYAGWMADSTTAVEIEAATVELPFMDVAENAWYHDYVQYVYTKGLMNGTSKTQFSPDVTTTRGMIVTILYRLANKLSLADEPAALGEQLFTDVTIGSYYDDAIRWAAKNGIVDGYGDGNFGPDDPITREQLVTILYRYANVLGLDTSLYEDTDLLHYADAADVADYAYAAMQWACSMGLVEGSDGKLMPDGNATRAQVAALLYRFNENQ